MATISHIKKKAGWVAYETRCVGVVPNNDTIKHEPFNIDCPCKPKWDGKILVHNALDGRVKYER